MDINYFGLLRLAQEFGPALQGPLGRRRDHAAAWVNLLSVYALSNFPPHGTFSASKAAAHVAGAMPARRDAAGRHPRRSTSFPGPIDDEWNQNLPPPKVAPAALASAIVKALKEGIEDVYPATSRRSGWSAGARTRRCWSASWRGVDRTCACPL